MMTAHFASERSTGSGATADGSARGAGLLCIVGLAAAAAMSGCVRTDSMRLFYGRQSLVLSPESYSASEHPGAIATVPEDRD